jgi:hypothetical protein
MHDPMRAPTARGAAWRYRIFGWQLESELELPNLPTGDTSDCVDVTFRLGDAPPLEDAIPLGTLVSYNRNGCARIEIPGVAAFVVRDGREVVIAPQMAPDAPDIGVFLLGSVIGILCHQRGELPLHASCVEIDGRAVVFSGLSGTGKSTLAAAMVALGTRMLADDVAVATRADDGFRIMPSFPGQKLWRDALTALRLPAGRKLRSTGDAEKFEHRVGDAFCPDPRPLALMCHLYRERDAAALPALYADRFRALLAANESVYRLSIGQALNGQRMFDSVAALAKTVPQLALPVPDELEELSSFAARLPALLGRYSER